MGNALVPNLMERKEQCERKEEGMAQAAQAKNSSSTYNQGIVVTSIVMTCNEELL